ncbi:hypothetical protein IW15_18320 [Chryseobacterium soli]|uniref:Uncharacterized protein n=1 Tax=Chryseobacterium soli TaxID=445961 RepID=A0A086A343_9FLAO|nr:hypothetical protein [Chryseobacterium soli]KFF11107.1 hypothetical protein IW15_18320 [Chryseobacterium soli]
MNIHIKTYKTIVTILVLAFALSPCSVKRDLLGIFDIQHFSTLNKVKATASSGLNCETSTAISTPKVSTPKTVRQLKNTGFVFHTSSMTKASEEEKINYNHYSGHTTGNSPPKYILFKKLKLNLV